MQRTALHHTPTWWGPALTGLFYFLTAAGALSVSRFEGGLAFIWGANAFLMAQLMNSRMACWPRMILICGIASAVATALFGMGPLAAIPLSIINMAESLIVALICRRFAGRGSGAASLRLLVVFIIALGGVANIMCGLGAALVASHLTTVSFSGAWLQWYAGHVLGGLTCTPILTLLLQGEGRRWIRDTSAKTKVEALGWLILFALTTWWVFYRARYPLLFAPVLPLVIIAFRIGHLGSAASIVVLAFIGGAATMGGVGPISRLPGLPGEHIQFFQLYLAFTFLLSVPVSAELNGRRRLFQMLRESEERFRILAEHSGDVVFNLGVDGVIQYASPSVTDQIGINPASLIGRSALDLISPEDRAAVVVTHRRALAHGDDVHKVEFRSLGSGRYDGKWCEVVMRAILDDCGAPVGVVGTVRDISRHKALQEALQQVANRDALTGADSRRAFLQQLDEEIRAASRGARSCLLLIDIDHFKAINDRHGHAAGDEVLRAFVDRLRPGVRGNDRIGRLGGEEFAILLRNADIDRASRICERLRLMLATNPVEIGNGRVVTVTFSAGLVALEGAATGATMLEAADKALYRAKHSGRNCLRLAA
ncbi:diguanylate cyclase [Sphingobium sp. AN558]|uniref:sensor domain-containing diguanylate cyclase n=1 Tax=Sphingobium sp. AN558 TaxID=3133442 RepID=UPI0030BB5A8E